MLLIQVGKTHASYLREGIDEYEKRIRPYITFSTETLPGLKQAGSMTTEQVKQKEGEQILSKLKPDDYLVLLDERGKHLSSIEFAGKIQHWMNAGTRQVVFVIGGAFGFSEEVYKRAQEQVSLSKMTFSHQLIRLVFAEQIYRAFAIINRHPYHHE